MRHSVMVGVLVCVGTSLALADQSQDDKIATVKDAFTALSIPMGTTSENAVSAGEKLSLSCVADVIANDNKLLEETREKCTGDIPGITDRNDCRAAALIALVNDRERRLKDGDDSSIKFALTCGEWDIAGDMMRFVPGADGHLRLEQTQRGTSHVLPYNAWLKLLPASADPSRPKQWLKVVLHSLDRVSDGVELFGPDLNKPVYGIHFKAKALAKIVDDALAVAAKFPELATDTGVLAATRGLINTVKAQLETGAAHALVLRSNEPDAKTKARKRGKLKGLEGKPTAELAQSWRNDVGGAVEKLAAAIERFDAAQPK